MIDAIQPLDCGFELDSLLAVRRAVQQYASAAGFADLKLYYFVVAVNEIMTNAIHHGGGRGRLVMFRNGSTFQVEVVDEGPGIPPEMLGPSPRPAPDTLGGRGLWLARQLVDRLDIDTGGSGTKVTLVFDTHGLPDAG
jgi:serine/threonine-protein kinase RsbW